MAQSNRRRSSPAPPTTARATSRSTSLGCAAYDAADLLILAGLRCEVIVHELAAALAQSQWRDSPQIAQIDFRSAIGRGMRARRFKQCDLGAMRINAKPLNPPQA